MDFEKYRRPITFDVINNLRSNGMKERRFLYDSYNERNEKCIEKCMFRSRNSAKKDLTTRLLVCDAYDLFFAFKPVGL